MKNGVWFWIGVIFVGAVGFCKGNERFVLMLIGLILILCNYDWIRT